MHKVVNKYNFIKSNAAIVHKTIAESSVIITRFSSLIHESIAYGRPVIYYNPHLEKMSYDFEPDQKNLIVAYNKRELKEALSILSLKAYGDCMQDEFYNSYTQRHIGLDGKSSDRINKISSSSFDSFDNQNRFRLSYMERLKLLKLKAQYYHDKILM